MAGMNSVTVSGDTIRALREQRGCTLEDLSQRTKRSRSYLSRVENAQRTSSRVSMHHIANAIEAPLDDPVTPREKALPPSLPTPRSEPTFTGSPTKPASPPTRSPHGPTSPPPQA